MCKRRGPRRSQSSSGHSKIVLSFAQYSLLFIGRMVRASAVERRRFRSQPHP
jgi:hypothetical protein